MRTALVLGAGGAAGRAIALALVAEGWSVTGTGRSAARFPAGPDVRMVESDRTDSADLAQVIGAGADLVVDCVCFTAEHARGLLVHQVDLGAIVMLSTRAVYVDPDGRHINSAQPPHFAGSVPETTPTLAPDLSGEFDSAAGYAANKVAAEHVLLDAAVPVSVLRPAHIHGVGARRPREWFVVRQLLEGVTRFPLAHAGHTADQQTAAVNLARLVTCCAERPSTRVLNAGDPDTPTAADIVATIAAAAGRSAVVQDAPPAEGDSPWSSWPPFLLDLAAASEVGYAAVGTYAQTVRPTVEWLVGLDSHERNELDTRW